MHFIRPEFLLLLIPLAILLSFIIKKQHQQSQWSQYIAPHLTKHLIFENGVSKKPTKLILGACWFIAVIALAGPALHKKNLPVFATEQGRVLVLDMSYSMYATDLTPDRLSHAKFKATDLLNTIKEGETGLIAYAGDAFTISPLTRDNGTLLNLLPTLSPDIMPVRGSNVTEALNLAKSLLSQGGHVTGDIILLTDGISDSQLNSAIAELKNSRYRLSILAFGSQTGAPIKLSDGQLMRDSANEVVVAKTDIQLLQRLASAGNGIALAAQADGSEIELLSQWLAQEGNAKATELEGEAWQDLGPYFAILLLIPVLFSFKHGVVNNLAPIVVGISLISLGMGTSHFAYANSELPTPTATATANPTANTTATIWDNLWATPAQQAQQHFEEGNYQQAAKQFKQPNRQASALYKAGQFQEALSLFEQDESAIGFYNQGNSLMKLNQFAQAMERYEAALNLQPDMQQAIDNLELAKKLLEMQSQQQDKDQEQNQSDQNNQGDNQSEQDQSGEQGDQQGSSQSGSDNKNQDQDAEEQSQQDPSSEQNADKDAENQQQDQQENASQDTNDEAQQGSESSSQNDKSEGNEQQSSDNTQASAQGNQSSQQEEPLSNEAQMQADEKASESDASDNDNQAQANISPTASKAEQEDSEGETQAAVSPTQLGQEPLPEDLQRALRAINEDPQVLIRNKMQLEYQKRRQQGQAIKENEQW